MTRDEIMRMDAEELRWEIARLKGYQAIERKDDKPLILTPSAIHSRQNYFDGLSGMFVIGDCNLDPIDLPEQPQNWEFGMQTNWPTSIADAWELVEETKSEITMTIRYIATWGRNVWRVDYQPVDRKSVIFPHGIIPYFEADTAPLAICRAWLMAQEAK